jgi:multidrug resistance efflux pump
MWNSNNYIPTPWKRRWTRFCYRGVPVLGFVGCLVMTLWLWQRQGRMPMLQGEVVAMRVDVTAGCDGVLVPLAREPWRLFDTVQAKQVIARLDDRGVLASLDTNRKELQRIRADLEAAVAKASLDEADRDLSYLREATQLAVEHGRLLLSALDRTMQVEADRLALQRCDARIEHFKPLHEKNAIPDLQWTEEKIARATVAKRLEEGMAALRKTEDEEKAVREKRERLPARVAAETAKLLAPFQAAIESQQARIREREVTIEQLIVRTPIDGVICAILHRPGENIRAGNTILTIADPRGQHIVSYVRPDQRWQPLPGMTTEVRLRSPASRPVATRIERVGPHVESVPLHLCRDPKTPEWGLPVLITIPEGLPARPGELLDVSILFEGG